MQQVITRPSPVRWCAGVAAIALLGSWPAFAAKAPKTGPEAAAKLKAQADDLKSQGKMDEALKYYKNAVEADPANTGTAEDYGRALFSAGKYKDAAELFVKLTKADDPAAFWNLGQALTKGGDFKSAAEAYAAYTQSVPDDPDGYYQLGEVLRKLGRYPAAATAYDAYIAKETRPDQQAWVDKAKAKAAQMKAAGPGTSGPTTVASGSESTTAAPAPGPGMVVAMPGKTTATTTTVTTSPTPAPAASQAAPSMVAMPSRSTRDPNAAISKIREGDSLFKQARYREALFAYQDAVKLDDQSTNALLKEGLAYANMNYFKEAVGLWQHVLDIDPKNQYAPKYIAQAKPRLSQSVAAVDPSAPKPVEAKNLLAGTDSTAHPVTPEDEAAAKDSYRKAVQLINTQQYDQAIAQIDQALQRNPAYVNAYIARGGADFGLHKYSEAVQDYQKAEQLSPTMATPVYGLGRTYERLGDKLHACDEYRRYVASTANDVQPSLRKQAQDQLTALCGN
jgi:tetratricopeptide (TPR) repeat protein